MSHGRCDLSLYISTPYIYIYTFLLCSTKNYSKEITKWDIQWCSSPKALVFLLVILWAHGLGLGPHLGLGFLGLGLHVKNTNRKNFKCFGPWPFLLLMASLFACWDDPSSIASLVISICFLITSRQSSFPGQQGRGVPFCPLSPLRSSLHHCRVGQHPASQSWWRQGRARASGPTLVDTTWCEIKLKRTWRPINKIKKR